MRRNRFSLGVNSQRLNPKMLGAKGTRNFLTQVGTISTPTVSANSTNSSNAVIISETRGNGRGTVALTGASPWEVSLDITRETNNIDAKIPFAIAGVVNKATSYRRVFSQLGIMPMVGGLTASVVFSYDADTGDALFTWSVGGQTDIIRVHSTTLTDYATQLEMQMTGGSWLTSGFRYEAGNSTYQAQYAAYSLMTSINSFGGVTLEQSTRMRANKGPDQFQNAIIDVPIDMAVDSNYTIVGGFANDALGAAAPANLISWDFADVDFDSGSIFTRSNC